MRILTVIIIFVSRLIVVNAYSQNLVPNGSFENFTACPWTGGQLSFCNSWQNPTAGTPDYFNACGNPGHLGVPENAQGYQYSNSGAAYVGIWLKSNYVNPNTNREYIQVQLSTPLIANVTYKISFFTNRSNNSMYSTSRIGAYISYAPITDNTTTYVLNAAPQIENSYGNYISDSATWTEVKGFYHAFGGEQWITLGNFYNEQNTDSIVSGGGISYGCYYYIDDVSIIDSALVGISERDVKHDFSLWPNPSNDYLTIELSDISRKQSFKLINYLGQEIRAVEFETQQNLLYVGDLDRGIYFVEVTSSETRLRKKLILN